MCFRISAWIPYVDTLKEQIPDLCSIMIHHPMWQLFIRESIPSLYPSVATIFLPFIASYLAVKIESGPPIGNSKMQAFT